MDIAPEVQKVLNEVEYRFSQADGVDFNIAITTAGGVRLAWSDRNQDITYVLSITPNGWELTIPAVGAKENGFEYPPDVDEIVRAQEKVYDKWLQEYGDDFQMLDVEPAVPATSDAGEMLSNEGIERAGKLAFNDYPADELGEFYLMRDIPGDKHRLAVELGARALWERMIELAHVARSNGIQFERIDDVRYAGSDSHIDRAKLYFRVPVLAGPPPQRRATLSIVLSMKDGEVESPTYFIDSSRKERLLCEESLVAYLNFSQNSSNMHRQPKTERSLIDRTLLPSPPAHSMFKHVTQDTSWRNVDLQK